MSRWDLQLQPKPPRNLQLARRRGKLALNLCRSKGKIMRRYLAALALVVIPTAGSAWHNQGHMMVAEVAWQHMNSGARCRAIWLLNSDKEYARGVQNPTGIAWRKALFVNAATWPDRIKANNSGFHDDSVHSPNAALNLGLGDKLRHKYWHYADFEVPNTGAHPVPAVNALERIKLLTQAVSDPATAKALKAYDLAWLLHLVGDVHQPLHMANQFGPMFSGGNDAGGNGIPVDYPGFEELHGFWDGAPGDAGNTSVLKVAIQAADLLPAPAAADAAVSNVDTWGQESYDLAVHQVYVPPVMLQSAATVTPTADYVKNAQAISRARVALAGVRLANLLNSALIWPKAGCQ